MSKSLLMFATFYAIINYKVIWSVIPLIFVFTILYALRIQLQIVRKQYKLRINRPYFNSLVVVYHLTFAVLWIMYIVYQLIYHVDDFKEFLQKMIIDTLLIANFMITVTIPGYVMLYDLVLESRIRRKLYEDIVSVTPRNIKNRKTF